jgi:hypothetical protein
MTLDLELLKVIGAVLFLIASGIITLVLAIKFIPVPDFRAPKAKIILILIGFLLFWIGLIWAIIEVLG